MDTKEEKALKNKRSSKSTVTTQLPSHDPHAEARSTPLRLPTSRTARSVNSSPTEEPRTASRHAELAFFAFGMHGGFGGGVRRLVKSDAAAPPPMNRIPRPPVVSRLAAAERGGQRE
ncbi:hypothetical protein HPB50_000734 [Hyalomma asiaticum]|uniref:Uncharacterized protein n=1 Tax=Hyalomma asiaticum TaxID=266040 RepID=A0ACB7SQL0_HYAAI|nr:hypothetical protein HPB50_000734 [Hyalomma asiaticum]